MKFKLLVLIFCILLSINSDGQLEVISKSFDSYRSQALIEKIYIHMDRPYYLAGETVWFKIYYVDGSFHRPLKVSNVVYVDLVDYTGKIHIQSKVSMRAGNGSGCLELPTELKTGNYTVRAYTNWMRNFSENYYFSERLTLINTFLPLEPSEGNAVVENDVQFFPEGGHLVNDLTSKVAFRTVNQQGIPLDFSGSIVDNNNNLILTFNPDELGLGSFFLQPKSGNTYRAIIKYENSKSTEHNLPVSLISGYTMEVKDTTANRIGVTVKTNTTADQSPIYLFVHARNIKLFSSKQTLNNGSAHFLVHKDSLVEGVSQFTVFDNMLRPVCERLFFKKVESKLDIMLHMDKLVFSPREKVSLSIASPDQTSVSVAVYRVDSIRSLAHTDITEYLNLLSDLSGTLGKTYHYFNDSVTQFQLDNLMLTHNWTRFNWKHILQGDSLVFDFVPEVNGHVMRGIVKQRISGTPIRGIKVFSSIPSIAQFQVATTNDKGEFFFEYDYTGVEKLIVQTKEDADIEIYSPSSVPTPNLTADKFVFSAKQLSELQMRSIHMQVQNAFDEKYKKTVLKNLRVASFFGSPNKEYRLDDYTRFPTMEEVLREYVPEVSVRKGRAGYRIFLRNLETNTSMVGEPLILVDGVPVFDHNKLMDINPLGIEKLQIITQPYYFSNLQFDGIVNYISFKGDMANYNVDSMAVNYTNFQFNRELAQPKYEEATVPDTRHLLYWNPEVAIDESGKVNLEFYTSDVRGRYIVKVNGITRNGRTGSSALVFEVNTKK